MEKCKKEKESWKQEQRTSEVHMMKMGGLIRPNLFFSYYRRSNPSQVTC